MEPLAIPGEVVAGALIVAALAVLLVKHVRESKVKDDPSFR